MGFGEGTSVRFIREIEAEAGHCFDFGVREIVFHQQLAFFSKRRVALSTDFQDFVKL